MIIITGPGRSGTSLVAELYRDLGFDPGGAWNAEISAGREAEDIVRANLKIMHGLGVGMLGPPPALLSSPRASLGCGNVLRPLALTPVSSCSCPESRLWSRAVEVL